MPFTSFMGFESAAGLNKQFVRKICAACSSSILSLSVSSLSLRALIALPSRPTSLSRYSYIMILRVNMVAIFIDPYKKLTKALKHDFDRDLIRFFNSAIVVLCTKTAHFRLNVIKGVIRIKAHIAGNQQLLLGLTIHVC